MASVPVEAALAVEELDAARRWRAPLPSARRRSSSSAPVGAARSAAFTVGSVPERLLHEDAVAVAIAPAGYVTGEPPALSSVGVGFDGQPQRTGGTRARGGDRARSARVPLRVFGVIGPELVGPSRRR